MNNPFQITQHLLTSSISNQNKVYGASDPSLNGIAVTLGNIVNGHVTDINGNITLINDIGNVSATLSSLTRNAGENIGSYNVTSATFNPLVGSASANYNVASLISTPKLTINIASVKVQANAASKIYGSSNLPLAYSSIGLINGSVTNWMGNVTDIHDQLSGSMIRITGENVGNYRISMGTLSAGSNYLMNFSGANFGITPATLRILGIIAYNKIYNGNTVAILNLNSAILSGLLFNDKVNINSTEY